MVALAKKNEEGIFIHENREIKLPLIGELLKINYHERIYVHIRNEGNAKATLSPTNILSL
jgi:hypothetical protein